MNKLERKWEDAVSSMTTIYGQELSPQQVIILKKTFHLGAGAMLTSILEYLNEHVPRERFKDRLMELDNYIEHVLKEQHDGQQGSDNESGA